MTETSRTFYKEISLHIKINIRMLIKILVIFVTRHPDTQRENMNDQ